VSKGAIAVVWLIIAMRALVRWVLSDTEFAPAPLLGPDQIPAWNLWRCASSKASARRCC
jgi:hypothetical protein